MPDGNTRKLRLRRSPVGSAHIQAHRFEPFQNLIRECCQQHLGGLLVGSIHDFQDSSCLKICHHRHVALSFGETLFIESQITQGFEIPTLQAALHRPFHDAMKLISRHSQQITGLAQAPARQQNPHHKPLEHQRKTTSLLRPRNRNRHTSPSLPRTRGTRASRIVSNPHVSRCLQRRVHMIVTRQPLLALRTCPQGSPPDSPRSPSPSFPPPTTPPHEPPTAPAIPESVGKNRCPALRKTTPLSFSKNPLFPGRTSRRAPIFLRLKPFFQSEIARDRNSSSRSGERVRASRCSIPLNQRKSPHCHPVLLPG